MWNKTVAHSIDSMFTRDYPMSNSVGNPNKVGMQGGFWLVRPNLTIYDEYRQIILRGDFVPGAGWGGAEYRYGGFYGAAQIQGIVPYFYGRFHPQTFVELNRCVYNQMVDIPYHEKYGKCLTGEEICQDCREANVEDIYSAHFTLCGKPWTCPSIEQHSNKSESYKWMEKVSLVGKKGELCIRLHREWHRIRHNLEVSWGIKEPIVQDPSLQPNGSISEYFYGHCKRTKTLLELDYNYVPLRFPDHWV
jgi:hypothetical protein